MLTSKSPLTLLKKNEERGSGRERKRKKRELERERGEGGREGVRGNSYPRPLTTTITTATTTVYCSAIHGTLDF